MKEFSKICEIHSGEISYTFFSFRSDRKWSDCQRSFRKFSITSSSETELQIFFFYRYEIFSFNENGVCRYVLYICFSLKFYEDYLQWFHLYTLYRGYTGRGLKYHSRISSSIISIVNTEQPFARYFFFSFGKSK